MQQQGGDSSNKLVELRQFEWVAPDFSFDQLSAAARSCRRRMLRFSREDLEKLPLRTMNSCCRYQPKVERSSNTPWQTREAEALMRWRHPQAWASWARWSFCPKSRRLGSWAELGELRSA